MVRVSVDLNRCQAYAQCCFLAPEVFELRGQEVLLYKPQSDAEQLQRVLRSSAACPVQAISVEDANPREAASDDVG